MTRPAATGPAMPGLAVISSAPSRPAVTVIRRTLVAVAAVTAGMVAAWLGASSIGVLAAMAVLLAAGNGYSKAYSP
jgi:hypothetical protein